jgi:hypothetical protein
VRDGDALRQALLGQRLDVPVDRQDHVVAVGRRDGTEVVRVQHPALGVHLDDLLPRHAPQVRVVRLLDPGLPHFGGGWQLSQIRVGLHLLCGDRADVAEDLGRDVSLWIRTQ